MCGCYYHRERISVMNTCVCITHRNKFQRVNQFLMTCTSSLTMRDLTVAGIALLLCTTNLDSFKLVLSRDCGLFLDVDADGSILPV